MNMYFRNVDCLKVPPLLFVTAPSVPSGLIYGVVAAAVVAAVILVVLIILTIICCWQKRKDKVVFLKVSKG